MEYALDSRQTLIIAILVLFLGKFINQRFGLLNRNNIPDPVTGGVLVSLLLALVYFIADFHFAFALQQRDSLLIIFFTALGLSTRISVLLQGGRALLVVMALAGSFLFIQNFTGLAVSLIAGLEPVTGLLGGSISLSGGHGTAIAWAPYFVEQYGITNALEIGVAFATFGLVVGGVMGGPIAGYLISRYQLQSSSKEHLIVGIPQKGGDEPITANAVLNSLLVLGVAIGLGIHLDMLLESMGLKLPTFVSCLVAGVALTNTIPLLFKGLQWPAGKPSLALISDVSLGLFLSMSMMSLQLWTLVQGAGPILLLMLVQTIVAGLFIIFVMFRLLGKTYDAAVICAGYSGMVLGATPTAIANMTAVVEKYGASPQAFLIVPLVGACFIDLMNAVVLNLMLQIFG
jgi:ESS family glutamate:Na+ symporter